MHEESNLNEPLLPKGRETFPLSAAEGTAVDNNNRRGSSLTADQSSPSLNQDLQKADVCTEAVSRKDTTEASTRNNLTRRFRACIRERFSRIWSHVGASNRNLDQELRTKGTPSTQDPDLLCSRNVMLNDKEHVVEKKPDARPVEYQSERYNKLMERVERFHSRAPARSKVDPAARARVEADGYRKYA